LDDERLRRLQTRHQRLQTSPVAALVVVMPPALLRQDGVEAFGVEIEQVDLMAGFFQPGERSDANPRVKALGQRVAIEVENPHGRAGT
jgi:hypothetical protein